MATEANGLLLITNERRRAGVRAVHPILKSQLAKATRPSGVDGVLQVGELLEIVSGFYAALDSDQTSIHEALYRHGAPASGHSFIRVSITATGNITCKAAPHENTHTKPTDNGEKKTHTALEQS